MKYAVFFLSLLHCFLFLFQWSATRFLLQVMAVVGPGVWQRAVALGWDGRAGVRLSGAAQRGP